MEILKAFLGGTDNQERRETSMETRPRNALALVGSISWVTFGSFGSVGRGEG